MHEHAKRLAHMPTGRMEQAVHHPGFGITEAYADALIVRQPSLAGGLGARCALSGEREGRSPLASIQRESRISGEREGQRPLAENAAMKGV